MSGSETAWMMGAISFIQLVITIVTLAIHGTRKLTAIEHSLRLSLERTRKETDQHIDSLRREVGETLSAMRAKIQEVELYIRDHYVRRDSFHDVTQRIAADLSADIARVEAHLTKVESKIDKWGPRPAEYNG